MSKHTAKVVLITLNNHPNADALSIVKVDGFEVIVRTEDWKDKTKGIYIEPDTLVNTQLPQFVFLEGHPRIKVRRMRGVASQGLLIPAPEESEVGEDFWEKLGLSHYEPELAISQLGEMERPPDIYVPVYDVENIQKYPEVISTGELVYISSKIHGTSARAIYTKNKEGEFQFFVGSRNTWKKYNTENLYWRAILQYPDIEAFCKTNPNIVVYGEVFGNKVQSLTYGYKPGKIDFACFDLYDAEQHHFVPVLYASKLVTQGFNIPWVYSHGVHPYNLENIRHLAEQDDPIAKQHQTIQLQEGVVVRPATEERTHPECGRVVLKMLSNRYLESKG